VAENPLFLKIKIIRKVIKNNQGKNRRDVSKKVYEVINYRPKLEPFLPVHKDLQNC